MKTILFILLFVNLIFSFEMECYCDKIEQTGDTAIGYERNEIIFKYNLRSLEFIEGYYYQDKGFGLLLRILMRYKKAADCCEEAAEQQPTPASGH